MFQRPILAELSPWLLIQGSISIWYWDAPMTGTHWNTGVVEGVLPRKCRPRGCNGWTVPRP